MIVRIIIKRNSKAIVEVYSGQSKLRTYNVPTGKIGRLWEVCTYDASNGKIEDINEIKKYKHDQKYIGMSEKDIEIEEMVSTVEKFKKFVKDNGNVDKITDNTELKNALDNFSKLSKDTSDIEQYKKEYEIIKKNLDEYLKIISDIADKINIKNKDTIGIYEDYKDFDKEQFDYCWYIYCKYNSNANNDVLKDIFIGDNIEVDFSIDLTDENDTILNVTDRKSGIKFNIKLYLYVNDMIPYGIEIEDSKYDCCRKYDTNKELTCIEIQGYENKDKFTTNSTKGIYCKFIYGNDEKYMCKYETLNEEGYDGKLTVEYTTDDNVKVSRIIKVIYRQKNELIPSKIMSKDNKEYMCIEVFNESDSYLQINGDEKEINLIDAEYYFDCVDSDKCKCTYEKADGDGYYDGVLTVEYDNGETQKTEKFKVKYEQYDIN